MAKSNNRGAERLARHLIRHEAGEGTPEGLPPASRVCERLRVPLGSLMGTTGYSALLARAQVLARARKPVSEAEADVEIVAQLLGLLITFIGRALTLRLLQDTWPEMKDLALED